MRRIRAGPDLPRPTIEEYLVATPKSLRLRKRILDATAGNGTRKAAA
jgi:hypothetical protein